MKERKDDKRIISKDEGNRSVIFVFLLYLIILVFYHVLGYESYGDDMSVVQNLKPTMAEELLHARDSFAGWSSRFIINPLIWILFHFDIKVWGICNIAMMLIGLYCVIIFSGVWKEKGNMWLVLAIVLLFPFEIITDVGWVVTSVTYMWPLTLGLLSCFTIRDYFTNEKKCNKYWIPICIATLFAVNKEELSVTLAVIFLFVLIVSIKERKIVPVIYAQTFIAVSSVVGHLLSGDNEMRYAVYSGAGDLSLADKLIMGFVSTLHHLFFDRNYLFICFCVLLCLQCFLSEQKIIVRILSLIPVMITVISAGTGAYLAVLKQCKDYRNVRLVAPIIVATLGIVCIMICLYELLGNTLQYWMIFVSLAAGFAGRMTVGFSGRGFDAFERTYTFLYYIIILTLAFVLANGKWKLDDGKRKIMNTTLLLMCIVSVIRCVFEIGII